MKNRSLAARFGFALSGWKAAWQRERSFRSQTWCVLLAFVSLFVLQMPVLWWVIVVVICALVLAIELINSALEALIDLLHPEIHPEIKVIKDMLAGAVLAMSCAAVFAAIAMGATYAWGQLLSLQS